MTRKILTLTLALLCLLSFADEKKIDSKIDAVTVFLNGAQVTRTFSTPIAKGSQMLKVAGLSPYIDAKTIQVKGDGNFIILSTRHQINHIEEKELEGDIRTLTDSITYYQRETNAINTEMSALNEAENFLVSNKMIKGNNDNIDVNTLRGVHQYYFQEILRIRKEKNALSYQQLDINKALIRYKKQLDEINRKLTTSSSEVLVEIQGESGGNGKFEISYLVNNAGWYPSYDVRVKDINAPLKLVYKANVYQNTGNDWDDVRLTFSNANPYQSGDLPVLKPYYLNYTNGGYAANPYKASSTQNSYNLDNYISNNNAMVRGTVVDQNGSPIAFATIRVQGTAVGTITDEAGNWSMTMPAGKNQVYVQYIGYQARAQAINPNIQNRIVLQETQTQLAAVTIQANKQLSTQNIQTIPQYAGAVSNEIANASYGWSFKAKQKYESKPITVMPMENQTSVEVTVDLPFTVKSTGKPKIVSMNEVSIPAYYEYRTVPKLEEAAFLIARITDWSEYNLLEGEANLYFESTYIGRSILDVRYMTDTLNISLGRDKGVLVDRQKVKDQSTREFIGSDKIAKRAFDVKIRNTKSVPINIIVYDQVPLSQRPKDIEVTLKDKSGAIHDERTGELKWEFKLAPAKTKELAIKYQVKHPKKTFINLE